MTHAITLQDSMSSADTAFSHNHARVPYDSDDQDGRLSDRSEHRGRRVSHLLAYRQQLREKSQPAHIVCIQHRRRFVGERCVSLQSHPWHRISGQRAGNPQIYTPQTAGIHISEAATV